MNCDILPLIGRLNNGVALIVCMGKKFDASPKLSSPKIRKNQLRRKRLKSQMEELDIVSQA